MSNYYVSGCIGDGESVSTCDDDVAQFWTLYHRNDEGLSEGIIDCMFREDAEAAMRVYEQRDALAAKGIELCREAAHVYQKYNVTQMPDMDLVDCQTIQEFSDLASQLRAGKD